MKLSFIAEMSLPGDAADAVHALHMAGAFGELGHDVMVLTPWHSQRARGAGGLAEMKRRFAVTGPFRLVYLPYVNVRGRLRASFLPAAAAVARAWGAELAYTLNVRAAAVAVRLGLRAVMESHTPPNSSRGAAAAKALCGAHRLARWVFISRRLHEIMAAEYPIPAARVMICHDAVDLQRFAAPLDRAAARARVGLPVDAKIVVHCGHLYAGRGGELLIECAARRPDVQWAFVGGRPDDVARLESLGRARGVANLLFVGHKPVAELPVWLWAADVQVMPYTSGTVTSDGKTVSIEYASPMKLFEYMAAERAIVATRWPAVAEVLRDGENAVLVPPDDTAALGAGLARVLEDPGLAARLAATARRDVEAYTWTARARTIVEAAR